MKNASRVALVAWLIAAVYYFYQYMLRSAPAVMLPELSTAFGISAAGVASLAGLFYYGYSPFSLVAGVAMDKFGPRKVIPVGAALVGIGSLMFATGDAGIASVGRFLQGAGGVFALIGAVYIATTSFPAVAGGNAHRRHADVRHGRRVRGPVRRRADDCGRRRLEQLLARHGRHRPGDCRPAVVPPAAAGSRCRCQCRTGSGRAQCPGHGLS